MNIKQMLKQAWAFIKANKEGAIIGGILGYFFWLLGIIPGVIAGAYVQSKMWKKI